MTIGTSPEQGKPPEGGGGEKEPKAQRQGPFQETLIRPLTEKIASLEREISEKLDLVAENRRLEQELRDKDRELGARDTEIEKLKRDLVYQKRLLEKEIEDRVRVIEEKRALMDREFAERIARERDEFDRRVAEERKAWSEKLARLQEENAVKETELLTRQGFWTRFMKMLTWS